MEKKDPIDILELYTKKVINREKQKQYLKKNPRLWLKNLIQKKKNNLTKK